LTEVNTIPGKYPIRVIENHHELTCIGDECELLVCKSTGNQKVGKHRKKKTSA
jgi:hypothetical protein